tara:strand:- start:3654 stop:3851 length:198 start_codon:yes stop_codon:yes gene_type:complete
MQMSHTVSDEELRKAYEVAAKVVALHGETYLPIFERLEREYEARMQSKKALERAKAIAQSIELSS